MHENINFQNLNFLKKKKKEKKKHSVPLKERCSFGDKFRI